ncbi:hypothetical protein C3489_13500 [Streptomyces sp. Ru71]|nr:hypothetical protein C3489_13500 [Streptomyces sp. Ru71]
MTWTFSARAGLGGGGSVRRDPVRAGVVRLRLPPPVAAVGRRASAVVLRTVVTALRPRLRPAPVRAVRRRRPGR